MSEQKRPVFLPGEMARARFNAIIFSDSHGAFGDFLGAGYLYYGFAAALRSQVSVCIGSGGGFVPDLLAQAQRDLGITPAATYLIDANLPDLGFGSPVQPGGWQRPENDFLQRASDVTVLPMLSADAAALFLRQGIRIDYLHIDGDHSTRGVIADFEDYAPLLSDRGVISFHDAADPGVRKALDHIRDKHDGWERLGLLEVGAGTVFLRRKASQVSRLPQSLEGFVDVDRKVHMAPAEIAGQVADSAERSRFERWHYLQTPSYQLRYRLIADEINRPGGTVVEIGGFPNSVIDVLHAARRLYAIEPYAPADYAARLAAAARSRDVAFFLSPGTVAAPALCIEDLDDFALVWMGLDPTAACDTAAEFAASLSGLLRMVACSHVVALEFPDYVPSQLVWQLLRECIAPVMRRDITLDLSADPVGEEFVVKDGRAKRRIVTFSPGTLNPEHAAKVMLCAERLQAIKRRSAPQAAPAQAGHVFLATELPSRIGYSPDGVQRVARPGMDARGNMTYGPYIRLRPGHYRVRMHYAGEAGQDTIIGTWDACVGASNILARGQLRGTDGAMAVIECVIEITPEASQLALETRLFFHDVAELRLREITIEPVAAPA